MGRSRMPPPEILQEKRTRRALPIRRFKQFVQGDVTEPGRKSQVIRIEGSLRPVPIWRRPAG